MAASLQKYFRQEKLPHIWCPGCGHGIIMSSIVRAIDRAGLDQDKTVVVSGIGCSGRAPGYMNFDTLHTTHGRALAFATGIKMANPELKVIVITGDGDGAAIGGNHLIHAARRNIDITTILFNNSIYGMTGGQTSPLTPDQGFGTTSPFGNLEPNFDMCELVKGAGATYIARGAPYFQRRLVDYITGGLEHNGFSFIEAISQCPTYFGRKNLKMDGPEMLEWQKGITITVKAAAQKSQDEIAGKILLGVLHQEEKKEFTAKYQELIASTRQGGES